MRIVAVSDVSVGYGSPQIPALMLSLKEFYGSSEITIIEPDQPEKAPKHDHFSDLNFIRVKTSVHPHSDPGRIQYNILAAQEINRIRPDVLVIFCTYSVPVLFRLKEHPNYVIYYAIESTPAYGPFDVEMNRHLKGKIDVIIFPEENRAARDIEQCGYKNVPIAIMFNSANSIQTDMILPAYERNGKILYQGSIEEGRAFAEYFLEKRNQSIDIDLYGVIGGQNKDSLKEKFSQLTGGVRYQGYVDSRTLVSLRKNYAFSLVLWNPYHTKDSIDENLFYACPNKFFESIAEGVPPITTPHPQCKMIVERYQCGIVMDGWDYDSFYQALRKALKIYGTGEYSQMIENCKKAVSLELNWDKQFEKLKPYLRR